MKVLKLCLSTLAVMVAGTLAGCSTRSTKAAKMTPTRLQQLAMQSLLLRGPTPGTIVRDTRMSICKIAHRGPSR
jgi:hypothetical protein